MNNRVLGLLVAICVVAYFLTSFGTNALAVALGIIAAALVLE